MEAQENTRNDSFVKFYLNYYEAAEVLGDNDRLAFYDAIFEYCFNGKEPDISGTQKALFLLAKSTGFDYE